MLNEAVVGVVVWMLTEEIRRISGSIWTQNLDLDLDNPGLFATSTMSCGGRDRDGFIMRPLACTVLSDREHERQPELSRHQTGLLQVICNNSSGLKSGDGARF